MLTLIRCLYYSWSVWKRNTRCH